MDNYLAAEPLIVARLKEQIPDIPILSTWQQREIQEADDLPAAVMVFMEEDNPGKTAVQGRDQKIEQVWLVLVVVREGGQESGELIADVIRALAGWKPDSGMFAPFMRVPSAFSPDLSPGGVFYFPIAFSTSFVFQS